MMGCMLEKDIIARNFGRSSGTYSSSSDIQKECASILLDRTECPGGAHILELGCGTGFYTELVLRKFEPVSLTALDISSRMVANAARQISDKKVRFLQGDAERMRELNMFELITSNCTLQWFSDLGKYFTGMSYSMRNDAHFSFSIYGPGTFRELGRVFDVYFGKKVPLQAREFMALDELAQHLKDLFKDVREEKKIFTVKYDRLLGLLRNIKHCGMRGKGLCEQYLTKGDLDRMEHIYKDLFGAVYASHEVGFFNCALPKGASK